MAVVTWRVDFTLTSPLGTLTIPKVMLDATRCSSGAGLRVTDDDVPSGDGAIFHQRFKSGYQMTVGLNLYGSAVVMVGTELQAFYDTLMGHLDALVDNDGRISWTVSGGNDRMLLDIRTRQMPAVSAGVPVLREFTFAVESPYPYAMDAADTTTPLPPGSTVAINRGGSAKGFFPVAKAYGPASAFSFLNLTSGATMSYGASFPGATSLTSGHYAEIDFFKKTVTLDGDVAFLSEGVDWANSDFWPLTVGSQSVKMTGAASSSLIWQAAHA